MQLYSLYKDTQNFYNKKILGFVKDILDHKIYLMQFMS